MHSDPRHRRSNTKKGIGIASPPLETSFLTPQGGYPAPLLLPPISCHNRARSIHRLHANISSLVREAMKPPLCFAFPHSVASPSVLSRCPALRQVCSDTNHARRRGFRGIKMKPLFHDPETPPDMLCALRIRTRALARRDFAFCAGNDSGRKGKKLDQIAQNQTSNARDPI